MTDAATPVSPRKRARRLAALQRRADHLDKRIAQHPIPPLTYDIREADALRWAIAELEARNQERKA